MEEGNKLLRNVIVAVNTERRAYIQYVYIDRHRIPISRHGSAESQLMRACLT